MLVGMRICYPAAFYLLLMLTSGFLTADDRLVPPSGGTSLFPADMESQLRVTNHPDNGSKRMVPVEGVPFIQASEFRTLKATTNIWDFQMAEVNPSAIHKGDVLWISLWMRATETSSESHEGFTEVSLEQSVDPYAKVSIFDLATDNQWRQFAWTAVAERDYAPGATAICLRGGYKPQVIQIGGLQILDYGTAVKSTDLPRSKITYSGMEADAPWRKAAADRIEKYRKADVKVIVQDAAGKPVPGATVKIEQVRHAFGFGSCVTSALIEGSGPDSERYREIIKNNYTKVVIENDLKWPRWDSDDPEGHKTTLAAIQWLHNQGITVRGHNLVWPSWENSPKSLEALKQDPAALEQRIEDHIKDEVSATKGQLTEWDVVNEPYANHDILDLIPPDAMASWFKLVHQIDPKPELFLNDYAGFMDRGGDTLHKEAFEKTLRSLKEQGAPIGGLGIQAHFGQQLTGPEQIVKELDRWAALGLDIQITEFDLDFDDEATQAHYTRDFMTAVFSHPAVSAILMWGFWENAHWRPQSALYRKDWTLKPNGQAWSDLVLKEWHTSLTADTDAPGTVSTRAFLGDYQVTVTYHGASKTWPLTVSKDGAVLTANLPTN